MQSFKKSKLIILFCLLLGTTYYSFAQEEVLIEEPPPPIEAVESAVIGGGVYGAANDDFLYYSPQNVGYLFYSTVKKTDYRKGDKQLLSWASALLNAIEKGDFITLKTFGIDSASVGSNVLKINRSYKWPEEASPGLIENNQFSEETVLLRTYYDKISEKYTYKYQVEIRFDKNNTPSLVFREEGDVVAIDDILNLYYSQLRGEAEKETVEWQPDLEHPCIKPVFPIKEWKAQMNEYYRNNRYPEAIAMAEKCLWANPFDGGVREKRIYAYIEKYDFGNAVKELNWLEENGHSVGYGYHYLIGYSYYNLGKYDLAIEHINHMKGYGIGGNILVNSFVDGKKDAEAKAYISSIKRDNISTESLSELIKLSTYLNETEGLDTLKQMYIERILRESKAKPRAIASAYFHIGEYENTVKYHRMALQQESDKDGILKDLAEALITNQSYTESYQISDKLLKDTSWDMRDKILLTYLNVAARYLAKTEYKAEQKALNTLLSNSKDVPKCHCWSFDEFLNWLNGSKSVSETDKKFVLKLTTDIQNVLNP